MDGNGLDGPNGPVKAADVKRLLESVLLFTLCCTSGSSAALKIDFKDYPATNIFKGKTAPVDLRSDAQARMYRTQLRTQTKEGVNFAGHFRIVSWGCGSECAAFAIADCANGKVHFSKELPLVTWAGWEDPKYGLDFRKDSCLLIARGSRQEEEAKGTYFYLWDGKKLTLLDKALK